MSATSATDDPVAGDLPGLHWCITAFARHSLWQLIGRITGDLRIVPENAAEVERFAMALAEECRRVSARLAPED